MKKSAERDFVQDVMEKLCYVAFDYDTMLTSTVETDRDKTYLLPDGNIITVGAEIITFPKLLFQPSPTGQEASGFHDTSFRCVMKCCIYTCKDLYANACCVLR